MSTPLWFRTQNYSEINQNVFAWRMFRWDSQAVIDPSDVNEPLQAFLIIPLPPTKGGWRFSRPRKQNTGLRIEMNNAWRRRN